MNRLPQRPELILASGSPRRRELLAGLGLRFAVRPADIDESIRDGEPAATYVERLAEEKAVRFASPGEIVLAADTVVLLDGVMLGKPEDADDAGRMLRRIAGRVHTVLTGVALYDAGSERLESVVETCEVRIADLDSAQVSWYVSTGEPLDKAGAYAIQDRGALFVEWVRGNYTNVVGLPLPATYGLFAALGFELRDWIDEANDPLNR